MTQEEMKEKIKEAYARGHNAGIKFAIEALNELLE